MASDALRRITAQLLKDTAELCVSLAVIPHNMCAGLAREVRPKRSRKVKRPGWYSEVEQKR